MPKNANLFDANYNFKKFPEYFIFLVSFVFFLKIPKVITMEIKVI